MNFSKLFSRDDSKHEKPEPVSWNAIFIESKAREIVAEQSGHNIETIVHETKFHDLDDSVGNLEITIACEETFDIDISDEDAASLVTFGQLVEYLCSRLLEST